MTEDQLAAIEARATAAGGPLEARYDDYGREVWFGGQDCGLWTIETDGDGPYRALYTGGNDEATRAVAMFHARAAPDVLTLAAEVRRLRTVLTTIQDGSRQAELDGRDGFCWASRVASRALSKPTT